MYGHGLIQKQNINNDKSCGPSSFSNGGLHLNDFVFLYWMTNGFAAMDKTRTADKPSATLPSSIVFRRAWWKK